MNMSNKRVSRNALSPTAAACMFLVWLEPTDRALSGWRPFENLIWRETHNEHAGMSWLKGQVCMTNDEQIDVVTVAAADAVQLDPATQG